MTPLTSGGSNQPKNVTCYLTFMLVPSVNIYMYSTIYYISYFGFCLWHLSLKPGETSILGLLASVAPISFPGL